MRTLILDAMNFSFSRIIILSLLLVALRAPPPPLSLPFPPPPFLLSYLICIKQLFDAKFVFISDSFGVYFTFIYLILYLIYIYSSNFTCSTLKSPCTGPNGLGDDSTRDKDELLRCRSCSLC